MRHSGKAETAQGPLTKDDRDFIRKAMEAGNTEVAAGKLAQEKATDDEIRKFGQRMVEDRSKAGEQLATIAQQLGYRPPSNREKEVARKKAAHKK